MKIKEAYRVYYIMGISYMELGNQSMNAYSYMNKSLQSANLVYGKNSKESAEIYLILGRIYKGNGDVCNALNNFRVAVEILQRKEGNKELKNEILKEIAICDKVIDKK